MWAPWVQRFSGPAEVLLCAIAYFAHMDASTTVYSHNYQWPFDIQHNGDVARDETEFDTPVLQCRKQTQKRNVFNIITLCWVVCLLKK